MDRLEDRDIVEKLLDFERYGVTATQRYGMRMRAAEEIRALRAEVKRLRDQRKTESTVRVIQGHG
jgi:hypothetical protein